MSSRFLTSEQQHSYGRYVDEPTELQLGRFFHLDDVAKQSVQKRRGDYNQLGFAIQLCTVRFLGTFLINPIDVPQRVIDYLASQLEIADVECLPNYLSRPTTHWVHAQAIKKHYGYRDFSEQPEHWRLVRWLYQRAWIGGESPSMMFDLITARLVEQKTLLPGVTVLSRLISTVRERVANRTWKTLSKLPSTKQIENLEALIVVEEKVRTTPLEQLRKSPTRKSAPSLVNALNRLVTIRALGINKLDVGKIPPIRFKALSKTAFTLRAQAIARMSTARRIATLVAWAYVMEAIAIDDALDVLNLLVKDILAKSQTDGKKNRLRTLKDLDAAALQLARACRVLLNPATEDTQVREEVWQRLTPEQLSTAIADVEDIARPPEDNYYDELLKQWRAVRRFLPKLLSIIDFEGNQAGQKILEAWQFLQSIEGQRNPIMDAAPLKIVDKKWAVKELMTDTSGYSDVIFGLFWLLGYQFSPRLADAGSARFWRLDSEADYGLLDNLARQTVKTELIEQNWDDMLRVAGSLKLGTVSATEIMRALQRGKKPSTIARAIGELGKITKTLYLLNYVDDEAYRRRILTQLNRGESRHSLARALFYGRRGEIRQRYREGQEEQLGTLGLVVNVLVLWNTYYMDAAINQLQKEGWNIREEDKARLSPLPYSHFNMLGRYQFNLPEELKDGALRPLRDAETVDELADLNLW